MKPKERKISIDVLVEGPGGELVFREVKASKEDLHDLIEISKNPVIKHNVFRKGSNKRLKV